MKKFIFLSGFFLAAIGAGAQVTIGSGNPPSEYSLLDIDTSVQKKGFHLPRLTTGERDALTTTEKNLTEGLVIFNTETLCLEYWNQKEWVSLCKTDDPCANLDLTDRTFCSTENKKVSDLGSRIEWYDAATGGSPLAATTALATGSYYAGNCEDGVRQEVKVMLADCSSMPAAGAVTAWTNVMYDFQTQQLEAFGTAAGGGDAVSFKWQVSSTSESAGFTDIAGAPNSAFYTIPENYVHGFSNDGKSQELWFRCERTNPKGTTVTAALKMLNIITTDGNGNFVGGYGEQGGVKYLEIQSLNQHHVANGQKVKIALTNLGATNDNNLGDFYQWGRVADGHQVIGWTKSTGTARNNAFDAATDANRYPGGTVQIPGDGSANREPVGLTLSSSGQVKSGTDGYGKFIPAGSATTYADWSNSATRTNRWGNGSIGSTRTSDIAFSSWTFNGVVNNVTNPDGANNNPCPGGWSVPSYWQWKDMHDGNGSDTVVDIKWSPDKPINNWGDFRPAQYGSVGGAVITNPAGEKVFLPAAGYRGNSDGLLSIAGLGGNYRRAVRRAATATRTNYTSTVAA